MTPIVGWKGYSIDYSIIWLLLQCCLDVAPHSTSLGLKSAHSAPVVLLPLPPPSICPWLRVWFANFSPLPAVCPPVRYFVPRVFCSYVARWYGVTNNFRWSCVAQTPYLLWEWPLVGIWTASWSVGARGLQQSVSIFHFQVWRSARE